MPSNASPEFVTTGVLAWTEDPEDGKFSTKMCEESFTDDHSK